MVGGGGGGKKRNELNFSSKFPKNSGKASVRVFLRSHFFPLYSCQITPKNVFKKLIQKSLHKTLTQKRKRRRREKWTLNTPT